MKLNKIFTWGMIGLIAISVVIWAWGFFTSFETNNGLVTDVLIYWTYVMVAIAAAAVIVVGLWVGIKNNPKDLIKLGLGVVVLVVLCGASLLFAKGEPAMGMLVQPSAGELKLTDTILNLTYIVGVLAIIAIIAGEVRMAMIDKKK